MKKLLIASTALVGLGFAGAASADGHAQGLTISGSADIGWVTVDNGTATGGSYFVHDFDLSWSANGTTDAGLAFGASGDMDDDTSPTVYLSGSWGRIEFGDANDGMDAALPGVKTAGLEDGNSGSTVAQSSVADYDVTDDGIGGDVALYTSPTFGGATFYFSHGIDDQDAQGDSVSLGVKYVMGGVTIGAGVAENDTQDAAGIGVQFAAGPANIALQYRNIETQGVALDDEDLDASVTFAAGAGTVGIMASFDLDAAPGTEDENGYGIWYDMPLGGGATLNIAAGHNAKADQDEFGVGVSMAF